MPPGTKSGTTVSSTPSLRVRLRVELLSYVRFPALDDSGVSVNDKNLVYNDSRLWIIRDLVSCLSV